MLFTLYIKPFKRKAYHAETTSIEVVRKFLCGIPGALVEDSNAHPIHSVEELEEYVKNIRSIDRTESNNTPSYEREIFESSSGQILGAFGDNPESSTECDN